MENLNPAQRAAVEYCDGPSLVIAGAGSGKTRVLTYKIAYLIEHGFEPWSILALTFTNKAADEMKARVARIVGEEKARYLWMGTFHSVFLRILRYEHDRIGFQSNFTIYDAADSKSLIKTIIKEMQLDDKTYKPSNVQSRISNAKNQLVTAQEYVANPSNAFEDARSKMPALGQIFLAYSNRLHQANSMDFDDILVYTYQLLANNEDVRQKYAERFAFVLVDEYQDTNFAQHQIVWQLTKERQRVCVVGDDAQSIYSFRGANIDNILTFQDLYRDSRLFKLEQNYRSTQIIVEAANSLIHKNAHRIDKKVFSENAQGERIPVLEAYSDVEEAQIVVRQIRNLVRAEHLTYSDFAILYRTNAQSRVFEEALMKQAIPHQIYGGFSFYQRKEIKDVMAYLRMAVNPDDEEALKRIINYPARGIGQTTVAKLSEAATQSSVSLWQVLSNPLQYGVNIAQTTITRLDNFRMLIQQFINMSSSQNVEEVGRQILSQSGIISDIYADKTPEGMSKQENIEELVNGMSDFVNMRLEEGNNNVSVSDYLSETSLLSDTDMQKNSDEPKVTLMTVHSAKGLEFPTVFVVGLEENLFPSLMAGGSIRELEEERRLFYVAITRAERHCYLSYAKSRYRYGKMEFGTPSRFLKDIDPRYLTSSGTASQPGRISYSSQPGRTSYKPQPIKELFPTQQERETITPSARRLRPIMPHSQASAGRPSNAFGRPSTSSATSGSLSLTAGDRVLHQKFGEGTVERIEGVGDNAKAYIQFKNTGNKQLLLKFAKLTKI